MKKIIKRFLSWSLPTKFGAITALIGVIFLIIFTPFFRGKSFYEFFIPASTESRPYVYVKYQDGILDTKNKKVEYIFTLANSGDSAGIVTSEEFAALDGSLQKIDTDRHRYDPGSENLSMYKEITYNPSKLPANLMYRIKYTDAENRNKKFCIEYRYEFIESENGKLNLLSNPDCEY
jgi:hypothetical protein